MQDGKTGKKLEKKLAAACGLPFFGEEAGLAGGSITKRRNGAAPVSFAASLPAYQYPSIHKWKKPGLFLPHQDAPE